MQYKKREWLLEHILVGSLLYPSIVADDMNLIEELLKELKDE